MSGRSAVPPNREPIGGASRNAAARELAAASVAGQPALPSVAVLLAAGLAIGVGLLLALALTTAAGLSADWGPRWRALAQVHGQVMTVGWAGLFVLGMASRLLPRFSGARLRFPALLGVAAGCLAGGLILRALVQPFAALPGSRALLVFSGVAVALGAASFALSLYGTLARPLRERRPFAAFCAAGGCWLIVSGLLTVWALVRAGRDGAFTVAASDDAPLILVEFYGFLLCFVLGVSLRTIPTLFAWKPPAWLVWFAFLTLQGGLVLAGAARLAEAGGHAGVWPLTAAGRLLLAIALLAAVSCMGVWRLGARLRENSRPIALLLRCAYAWLAVTSLLLAYGAARGLQLQAEAPAAIEDAARHVFALGVVSTLIVGMAYLVGHMFAVERAESVAMARRIRIYAVLLGAAVVLRAGGALLEERGVLAARYWPMAMAAVLALAALALFTWRLVWGLRHPYLDERARRGGLIGTSINPSTR
ncbi:MAG TPA: hypothetical protein VFD32_09285 [Dehalococcoidia bacterium]|nr:hypothetical protein [Dehalococcoidia bacterium]